MDASKKISSKRPAQGETNKLSDAIHFGYISNLIFIFFYKNHKQFLHLFEGNNKSMSFYISYDMKIINKH